MRKIRLFLLVFLVINLFVACMTAPEYKPTKESSATYDIIDEDEK